MTVLVAVASRHGATREIAEAIGRGLSARGVGAEVRSVDEVDGVAAYEAVVLGSAVYAGRWLKAARQFAEANAEDLAARPTWLFSSGPIGDPPRPSEEEAVQVGQIVAATAAREHRVFAGKLDKRGLSFAERAVVVAFRAAEGDFRDWEAIAAWADAIADVLESLPQPSSSPSASA
jgi:menaquinone-dependent protoporphyrinogen oxidase